VAQAVTQAAQVAVAVQEDTELALVQVAVEDQQNQQFL
jgi:hypothetical protein